MISQFSSDAIRKDRFFRRTQNFMPSTVKNGITNQILFHNQDPLHLSGHQPHMGQTISSSLVGETNPPVQKPLGMLGEEDHESQGIVNIGESNFNSHTR